MAIGEYQGVAVDPSTNTLVPTTTTKSDWSTRLPSAEEATALGKVEEAQKEQQQIVQDQIAAAKEQDLNARLAAEQKAQDAVTNQQAMEKANAEHMAQRRQLMGEIDGLAKEKQKAAKYGDYWEDKSTGAKILAAIAVGLGGGAQARGERNPALEIFNHAQELDLKKKQDKLDAVTQDLKAKGASLEQLDKFHELSMKNIEATRLAQDRATSAYIEGLGAMYPQHQEAAKAAAAALAAQSAEKMFENTAKIHEVRKSGGSSTTTPGTSGQKAVDFSTKQAVANANETSKSMRELGEMIAKNPKAWKEYQDAFKAEQQSTAWKEGAGKSLASSAQFFGAMPVALDQRIKSPEARKINAALAPLITAKAREMDPIGALNQSAYDNAARSLNIVTAPPTEMRDKAFEYADRNARLAAAYSATGLQVPTGSPTAASPKTGSAPRQLSPQQQQAMKWATEHPKDPRSKQVIQKLRAELGQ